MKKTYLILALLLTVSVNAFAIQIYQDLAEKGHVAEYNCSTGLTCTKVGNRVDVTNTSATAAAGPILKQGANGRVGVFTCNGTTPVTVNNTSIAISDAIIVSLNTVGGTVGALPSIKTITAASGFTISGTASDTSIYNYAIIKNQA